MANQYMLEYKGKTPSLCGLWGPFDTRSQGDDFARALGDAGAAWVVVTLRNPNEYTFPEES